MSNITDEPIGTPACSGMSELFLHPLLEDPSKAGTAAERRTQQMIAAKAEGVCLSCPIMVDCLYRAVVEHDVAGYVAGTTQRQRNEMRSILKIRVMPEDFDSFLGVNSGRQVDHDEVLRMRAANPSEPLGMIAARLGCSLSTVKRHLRKARDGEQTTSPTKRLSVVPPTRERVLEAYNQVVNRKRNIRGKAA